jgi:hypothetical protein
MHLRGPMNISQLAVYQMPNEALKMRKRNTVPFYNQQTTLGQRGPSDTVESYHSTDTLQVSHRRQQTQAPNNDCGSAPTVTSTVYVTNCGKQNLSSITSSSSNAVCVDPPSPSLHASGSQYMTNDTTNASCIGSSRPTCTYQASTLLTKDFERQPPVATGLLTTTQSARPTNDHAKVGKRAAAWDRIAYYTSSAPAQTTGFSFLANLGDPQKSGTFD